jgi:hypothetical protein
MILKKSDCGRERSEKEETGRRRRAFWRDFLTEAKASVIIIMVITC